MSQEKTVPVAQLLSRALHHIRTTPPRIIASPPTQPRRAAVALIIRVVPSPFSSPPPRDAPPPTLTQFFELDWVEILFLRRDGVNASDSIIGAGTSQTAGPSEHSSKGKAKDEANIAFPGGRMEEGDEGGLYTAMRQTWEEIGLDLAERDFTSIGQLDDREITTSLGKRLLMILSPFVFLQLTPYSLSTDPSPGTTIHWTPLDALISAVLPGKIAEREDCAGNWSTVTVDAASRLAPRHAALLKVLVRVLIGSMQFPAILLDVPEFEPSSTPPLPTGARSAYPALTQDILEKGMPPNSALKKQKVRQRKQLKLWGLSLGMTLDLIAHMSNNQSTSKAGFSALQLPFHPVGGEGMRIDLVAPSLASVFPRFSYPPVSVPK
ncbi:hypothetical protein SERLA73DRAFT_165745 [Serpula lacrymans var. lacrymans S7.3]|uniref:Nudix hydrolase domain-containing protein n=1 Tax=Serpula lacrymans var. lacrymans (strain S7.3) TaxID=936435 RepID=F8PMG6_SERL3|nr:hypothetical protein SERLA73DRAFT_165745 [Serpula lacrymans var. lacrymans S7.3]